MEAASSSIALLQMLEGELPVDESSLDLDSHTLNEGQAAPDNTRWVVLAVLVSIAAVCVFFGI
jgi:hypothetical protein